MDLQERKMPWWFIVLTGVVLIIVSIFLLADRMSGLMVLTILVALGAAIYGLYNLVLALKRRDDNSASIPLLVHGLLDILLVLLIIVIPDSQALLGIIIACWLIVFGLFEILSGRRDDSRRAGKLGALLLIIGLAVLIIPLVLHIDYIILIAIAGLVFGIFRIIIGVMVKSKYEERTTGGRSNLL